MIYKIPTNQPGLVCVVFELPSCVWADHIYVSGTFNRWDERAVPMLQDRDGIWRARVEMALGRCYEFRYLIDGRWQTDYHADGFAENGLGSHNSIVDLTLVMALPLAAGAGSQVSDGQVRVIPHLPVPSNVPMASARLPHAVASAEMSRMRPRVAAA